ncbi:hypothetical protein SK128_018602 [Halocaridina rubra]|uniref:Uncharacterized protein n=1 Tax=Halocaridina rubra TaxID=373956 RepID=A0AAN8X3P7_HALRR
MKGLLLLLAAIVASTSAQSEGWCRCAAFVTYEHTEAMVYESAEIPITDCVDDAKECKNACVNQLNTMSNNGDLWHLTESGITVGQSICTYLADIWHFFVHNHRVYGYYEICGGAWQYTGIASQQMLCCNGGKQEHCVTE